MTMNYPVSGRIPGPDVRVVPDGLVGFVWWRVARVLALLFSDLIGVSGAGVIAYFCWAGLALGQPSSLYLDLLPLAGLFPLGYAISGLYPGFGLGAPETLRRLSRATSLILVTTAALVFVLKPEDYYSRVTFGLFGIGALLLVPANRFLLLSVARDWSWWPEPCVVVGAKARVESTLNALAGALTVGYRPAAVLTLDPKAEDGVGSEPPERLGREFAEPLLMQGIRTAILDGEAGIERSFLTALQPHFRHVILLRSAATVEMSEPRDLGGVFGLEFKNELLKRRNKCVKRGLDVLVSAMGLLVTCPLIVVSVVAVKLLSPGPALFHQVRVGRGNRAFHLWKIRTMVPNANGVLATRLASDPQLRDEWEAGFKLRNDPRVLPLVGTVLRRLCIDELPQLWNVLRGDMSLVGPRPLPRYHHRGFSRIQQDLRQRVRPGMTGLWQVRSEGSGDAQTQWVHDEYYVRNWSIWLDLHVLAKTVVTVARVALTRSELPSQDRLQWWSLRSWLTPTSEARTTPGD